MTSVRHAVLYGSAMLLFACLAQTAGAADRSRAALQGAWVQDGLSCSDAFARKGASIDFKRPVDVFAPTFIFTGKTLKTPQAACRIVKVTSAGPRHAVTLSCTSSVTVGGATAQFSVDEDGKLTRYFNAQDQTGSRYEKCNL